MHEDGQQKSTSGWRVAKCWTSLLTLFYFILFYFILFYFILFYFILFYFILFYFILCYVYAGQHSLSNSFTDQQSQLLPDVELNTFFQVQLNNPLLHIIKNLLVHAIIVSTSISHYISFNMQVVQLSNTLSHITKSTRIQL